MTTTSEAGQQALGLYSELKPQVDLLSERVIATAGIAQHADEKADTALEKLETLQGLVYTLQAELARLQAQSGDVRPSRAPLPVVPQADAIDQGDAEYLRKQIFGAVSGYEQVQEGVDGRKPE